jgi:hypothetical protein
VTRPTRGSRIAGTAVAGRKWVAPEQPTRAQKRQHVPVPRVDYTSVPCADCGAQEGSPCLSMGERDTPKGQPVKMFHRGRKRIATRRFNEARDAARNKVELPEEST